MRLAISTNWNSFRHPTADDMLGEIVALGFDRVELGYALTQQQAEGVYRWIEDGRIAVTSVHAFCPPVNANNVGGPECFCLTDPRDFATNKRGINALVGTAEFAKSVGASVVVLHAGRAPIGRHVRKLGDLADAGLLDSPKYQRQLDRVAAKRDKTVRKYFETLLDSLDEVLPQFKEFGLTLGLENLPTYDAIPNEPEMLEVLAEFADLPVGYWHDIGHGQVRHNLRHIHHAGIVSRFADKICGMHIHDVVAPASDHHMPPVARGTVKFDIFRKFVDTSIPLVLEPSRGTDPASIAAARDFLADAWQLREHDLLDERPKIK